MRLAGLASLLPLLALACNPGGDASSGATGTSATYGSTGTSATSGSTGTSADTSATSGPTSGAPATTGGSTSTTAPATTDASTATAATATTGAPSSTGDTGGPGMCAAANGDYGDCEAVLGVAFDGTECTTRSGCDCAPDCDKFFPDVASCALACADAGHCNEPRIRAAGIAKDPIAPGGLCDEIDVCPASPDLEQVFQQIFGMLTCEPMGGYPCQGGKTCHGLWQNMLGPEEWKKTCAASLVPGSGDIFCVIWGP